MLRTLTSIDFLLEHCHVKLEFTDCSPGKATVIENNIYFLQQQRRGLSDTDKSFTVITQFSTE